MSLLADTAADLGGCGTEDVPSLTRQHTGEPRLRAVPKFPDSSLPFAAHLAVASCSHHHHELLSRSAERAKTVSRAPRHSLTHLAAATTPAAPSGHTAIHRTTRKSFLFPGGFWAPSLLLAGTLQRTTHGWEEMPNQARLLHLFLSIATTQENNP